MSEWSYWNPMVPELTVTDLERSLKFYLALGFALRFRRTEPDFVYLELGEAQLMLCEPEIEGWETAPLAHPFGRGVNFQIEVAEVAFQREALRHMDWPVFREMEENWYSVSAQREEGQREFLVQDPDGYLLRFAEPLGQRASGAA